ncbi:MAG: glycogen synthase GlgA [Clostridiales bacterium]|nr:glycogen synthase GlgA [Clostridiales bacterium]
MKVLFVASEANPWVASGGLGDVAGSLPIALRRRLVGCRVVLPLYESVKEQFKDKLKFITSISVPVSWRRQYCGIFEARLKGVVFYFIDNQYYFKRDGIYGHYDDAERFAFFARAALEIIPAIEWKPDIIHCNDWQSALTPLYYSCYYARRPGYENIKTVFTIHNIQYQGKYGNELLQDVLGIAPEHYDLIQYDGIVNFLKAGIECANMVTTVSPSYAREILDPWYSHGLDPILNKRSWKLCGILNGIDTESYNPETDEKIYKNYSASDFSGKAENKAQLQKDMGLDVRGDVPLIGIVTRLVGHKGVDLMAEVLEKSLWERDLQYVVLGSGEWQYESFFRELAAKYPNKVALRLGFVPELARKIYAGADLFLMPSKSEPCGLSQMVALRYGTLPIVRETGGLRDSITDCGDGEGNGFTFKTYDAYDMLGAIYRADDAFHNKELMNTLVKRALECDMSWGKSANEYIRMYKALLK